MSQLNGTLHDDFGRALTFRKYFVYSRGNLFTLKYSPIRILLHYFYHPQTSGKVMSSQVSVCPQEGGIGTSHVLWDRSHDRVPPPLDIRPGDLLPVLTSSGGHQNNYGWQAGGMHPIGMLSCFTCPHFVNSSHQPLTTLCGCGCKTRPVLKSYTNTHESNNTDDQELIMLWFHRNRYKRR